MFVPSIALHPGTHLVTVTAEAAPAPEEHGARVVADAVAVRAAQVRQPDLERAFMDAGDELRAPDSHPRTVGFCLWPVMPPAVPPCCQSGHASATDLL